MNGDSEKPLPVQVKFLHQMSAGEETTVLAMPALRRWCDRLTEQFLVERICIERVVFFGKRPGFVLASAKATDKNGHAVPTTAFLRGDSVAVLPVLIDSTGSEWTVLLHQARVPVGQADYEEIPAGMLDEGVFASKALEELQEETGVDLKITEDHLVLLEEVHPSPGGSDETIRIYAAPIPIDDETLAKLNGARAGNQHESEVINVEVIPLRNLATRAKSDMKARLAFYAWNARRG